MQDLPAHFNAIKDDQPIVAQQVVAAGAGIRLRFNRFTATMRDAIERILMDKQLKSSAQRMANPRLAGGLSASRSFGDAFMLITCSNSRKHRP